MRRSSPEELRRAATALERSATRLQSLQLHKLVERAGPQTWRGRVAESVRADIRRQVREVDQSIERLRRRARDLRDDADAAEAER